MCGKTNSITLSTTEHGCILLCKDCMRFSLAYYNTSFCFGKEQLQEFLNTLTSFKESDFCYNILGESRAVLQTKHSNMGFSVSRNDIHILSKLINESLVMSEVYEVLGN